MTEPKLRASSPWGQIDAGHCAAIPTAEGEASGHLASHFGDLAYVRVTLTGRGGFKFSPEYLAKCGGAIEGVAS
jgi:hypothetical protein